MGKDTHLNQHRRIYNFISVPAYMHILPLVYRTNNATQNIKTKPNAHQNAYDIEKETGTLKTQH
jgi:hypothetical protein